MPHLRAQRVRRVLREQLRQHLVGDRAWSPFLGQTRVLLAALLALLGVGLRAGVGQNQRTHTLAVAA